MDENLNDQTSSAPEPSRRGSAIAGLAVLGTLGITGGIIALAVALISDGPASAAFPAGQPSATSVKAAEASAPDKAFALALSKAVTADPTLQPTLAEVTGSARQAAIETGTRVPERFMYIGRQWSEASAKTPQPVTPGESHTYTYTIPDDADGRLTVTSGGSGGDGTVQSGEPFAFSLCVGFVEKGKESTVDPQPGQCTQDNTVVIDPVPSLAEPKTTRLTGAMVESVRATSCGGAVAGATANNAGAPPIIWVRCGDGSYRNVFLHSDYSVKRIATVVPDSDAQGWSLSYAADGSTEYRMPQQARSVSISQ